MDNTEIKNEELEKENLQPEAEKAAEEGEREDVAEEKSSKADKKKTKKLEAEIEKLKASLFESEAQIAELNDKYARLFAEYDNYRKRTLKEREGIYTDAYIDAIGEILPILDNMERALQYKNDDTQNLAVGMELIMKSFTDTLTKMGVREIEALGKSFDPNLHNAVMHIDDESFGEGEIVEVFMKGYIKGDKVLRHSMVKVAN